MKTYKIVVLPGDGIGPEIVEASIELLDTVQTLLGAFRLDFEFHQAGAGYYQETGEPISKETLDAIQNADATFKGPVGLPGVRKPDGTEAGVLGGVLRVGFDLFANIRPMRLFPNVPTPLAGKRADDIDYIFLRENSQGLYLSRGVGLVTEDAATDTLLMTRKGCERICRYAFRLAKEKMRGAPEDGKKRVTLLEKSNVLRSFVFFRNIFLETAEDIPEIEAECLYVDAGAAALVMRPGHFHVVVTENMYGDILSDLAGATVGGLGMCPSANIGEKVAYFEPIHGSAPDIAGKNLANPISQIRSAAMMLDYLGEKKAAEAIEKAVWNSLHNQRLHVAPSGRVKGGARTVVQILKKELDLSASLTP
ncbi:MAG: isocitrate/isopropylmalate dehydrogenase family protein [Deltaproteobacteria bacterium]|nr:isocitrate/isopropylmalate dehydrogenase family protein [Deltaproteobacteria bacterium]